MHPDLTYTWPLADHWLILIGAGPTFVTAGSDHSQRWNEELELGRQFRRVELYARIRRYDYPLPRREGDSGPKGPAIYLGARFRLR